MRGRNTACIHRLHVVTVEMGEKEEMLKNEIMRRNQLCTRLYALTAEIGEKEKMLKNEIIRRKELFVSLNELKEGIEWKDKELKKSKLEKNTLKEQYETSNRNRENHLKNVMTGYEEEIKTRTKNQEEQAKEIERLRQFEAVHPALKDHLAELENRLSRFERGKFEIEDKLMQAENEKRQLGEEKQKLLLRTESLMLTLKKKETELQGKDEVIQKKNSDMEALNKHISDSKIYIEKLQRRKDYIAEQKAKDDLLHKETEESLQSRIELMDAQKTKDDLLHKETVESLQSRIQEMSAEKTDTVKKLQAHVDEERKYRFELSYQYSQLIQAKQAPENVKKQGDQEQKIQSLLLLRQDKEQQTELSHYIAELSDEKRPTKLAEEFSELYDNEWTDAFEDVPKQNEKQKVDFMLKLLMRANEICRNACTEHTSAIKHSFCTLVVETDPAMGEVCGEVPRRLDTKRTRQATDHGHGRTNAAKQKKIIETDFERTLKNEEKKTIMEIGKFFKQRLSEDVEKVGTEIILEEQNINQHSEAVAAYIRKCMNICWSMCRHMPPMHVDVPDVTGGIHFDTNKYKPYTKSGSYVHYIVWPALYLHEGGPLLCKCVAQGRK